MIEGLFADYDAKMKQNRYLLLADYEGQYGEEYREQLEKSYDETEWCFFENPRRLQGYIDTKSEEIGKKMTIDFLKKIRVDCSKITTDVNGNFTSTDFSTQAILSAFFPKKGYLCLENLEKGIFSFQNPTPTQQNLLQRAQLLKSIGRIQTFAEMKDFIKTKEYKEVTDLISYFLNILQGYKEHLSEQMKPLQDYLVKLREKEEEIILEAQKEFLIACKEHPHEIHMVHGFDAEFVKSDRYSNFLTDNHETVFSNEQEEPLMPGIFENFLKKPDPSDKKVFNSLMGYLLKKGASKELLDSVLPRLQNESWYQIEELTSYLPDIHLVQKVKQHRERIQEKCYRSLLELYTINNYTVAEDQTFDPLLRNILFHGTEKYAHRFKLKEGRKTSTIFISPLDANYAVADVTLDHELRHALESCAIQKEEGTVLKTGLSVSVFDGEKALGQANETIDEILTQKLSLEATRSRHQRGVYILTEKEFARDYATSNYDAYISNLEAAIPRELLPVLIRSKIEHTVNMPIYEYLLQEELSEVDSMMTDLTPENRMRLEQISDSLSEAYKNKKK